MLWRRFRDTGPCAAQCAIRQLDSQCARRFAVVDRQGHSFRLSETVRSRYQVDVAKDDSPLGGVVLELLIEVAGERPRTGIAADPQYQLVAGGWGRHPELENKNVYMPDLVVQAL